MTIKRTGLLLILLVFPVFFVQAAEMPAEGFYIPEGSAAAGRQAFIDLQCVQCHRVAGDETLPPPVEPTTAPDFNYMQSRYSTGWLMTSIVTPSHTISADRYIPVSHQNRPGSSIWVDQGGDSPMREYAGIMTVRQLIDIVAYLKSIDSI